MYIARFTVFNVVTVPVIMAYRSGIPEILIVESKPQLGICVIVIHESTRWAASTDHAAPI